MNCIRVGSRTMTGSTETIGAQREGPLLLLLLGLLLLTLTDVVHFSLLGLLCFVSSKYLTV